MFPRWRPGAYASASLRIFAWLVVRAAAQAANVLLLAYWLGAESYGAFVASLAVVSFFSPLAGLGLHAVLLRLVARQEQDLHGLLRHALRLWFIASCIATPAAVLALDWSLSPAAPLWVLVALAAAEVVGASFVEMIARVEQARHHAGRFGAMLAGLPVVRLAALLPLLAMPASLTTWLLAYAMATLAYVLLLAMMVWRFMIAPAPSSATTGIPSTSTLLREGAPFVTGSLALRLQAEFNKPVLAQLGYAQAGALGVAQRVVDLTLLPLAALQEALWPRVFASPQPLVHLLRSGVIVLVLSIIASIFLMFAAPLLPWLLGPDYAAAAEALRWLAWLPVLQVVRNFIHAWLSAMGYSRALFWSYATLAVAGILLAMLLIPRLGLIGAVWGMYGSEAAALIVGSILACIYYLPPNPTLR